MSTQLYRTARTRTGAYCARCDIRVFPNAEAARRARVPFWAHINLQQGIHCAACVDEGHGSPVSPPPVEILDEQPDLKEREMKLAKKDEVFVEFEVNVPPPDRTRGKYASLLDKVLAVPLQGTESEWCRFKFVNAKDAGQARNALRSATTRWKAEGHNIRIRTLKEPDDSVWLYVQRFQLAKE